MTFPDSVYDALIPQLPKLTPLFHIKPLEPFAHPPLVLVQQHSAQFAQRLRRVVEQAEDHFAVLDREPDELRLPLLRRLEPFGGVVVAASRSMPRVRGRTGPGLGRLRGSSAERTHVRPRRLRQESFVYRRKP